MNDNCCAFTGHRPKKFPWGYDEADSRCVELKAVLKWEIQMLIEAGVTDFYSGMAEGTDIWAASTVLELRKTNPALKLHCVVPFRGQADKWAASARRLYTKILRRANTVTYISEDYHDDCMMERNRYMVDHAAYLLAVYNGEWRGGTAATVRYARKLGREIIVIEPKTPRVGCRPGREQ